MKTKAWTAGELLKVSGSFWQSSTLHASIELDLFTQIGSELIKGEEIAARVNGDARATAMLLNALCAMGLLSKTGDQYANTPASKTFLIRGSPQFVGYMIRHHYHLVPSWAELAQSVRTGRSVRGEAPYGEVEREAFLKGMHAMAMAVAPRLSRELDLEGRRSLLDLGGGPGTHAIHFCLQNPGLRATVFDLPTTEPIVRENISRFGLSDRITFVAGDYLNDPVVGSYDVAWLSQILHGEGSEECKTIIRKATHALVPGGMILIHEFLMNDSFDGPLFPALFSLNMLVNTEKGQAYSEGQIRDMLLEAGLSQIRRLPFQGPNDSAVLCAIKPA